MIVRNTATDISGLAEVLFDRTAALNTAQAAVGIAPSSRRAYWWVNGSDRLNISTAGNVTIPGTVSTALTPSTLSVTGPSTLGGGATVSGNNLVVNTAIGIGTAGPSASLHVVGGGIITSTLAIGGLATANAGINVPGTNAVIFASDLSGKAANAGSIGSQIVTTGALDIYGAGTAVGGRGVKLWDNVIVPGTLAVAGTATTGALTASSVNTPALTVAGSSVYAQVNADFNATSGVAQILNKPTSNPLCQTFTLTGPWPASGTAGTNSITLKGGYQVWTGSIDCYATAVGLVTINWFVNGTNTSSSKM